jgi:bleomycin hydrolase
MALKVKGDIIMSKRKAIIPTGVLDPSLTEHLDKKFRDNPTEVVIRNAVNSVGSIFAATDCEEYNQNVTYTFLHTLKKPNVKATDQGSSGRCWMFAGFNIFRHALMKILDMNNFRFSATYLFFWDKFERANSFMQWFIDHPEAPSPQDRRTEYLLTIMGDGGWWSWFANLVKKYGVVPASAMPETYQSGWSAAMNEVLVEHCTTAVMRIQNLQRKIQCLNGKKASEKATKKKIKSHNKEIGKIKTATLETIYGVLVKYLGHPPKDFTWFYNTESDATIAMPRLTPEKFTNLVLSDVNMDDFVTLVNVPQKEYPFYKLYQLDYPANVYGGSPMVFMNVPLYEMKKYALKSILGGLPVWFGADVEKHFNWWSSALCPRLTRTDLLFGKEYRDKDKARDKGERVRYHLTQATHAMVLVGCNTDYSDKSDNAEKIVKNWQVENSWGYYDNEQPGLDGFLYMSDDWFDRYVIEIVVHKQFLSRALKKAWENGNATLLPPWSTCARASYVQGRARPSTYDWGWKARREAR